MKNYGKLADDPYPDPENEGDGILRVRQEWDGRLLIGTLTENHRTLTITASNRADLEKGKATYERMARSLPHHRKIKIVWTDEQASIRKIE